MVFVLDKKRNLTIENYLLEDLGASAHTNQVVVSRDAKKYLVQMLVGYLNACNLFRDYVFGFIKEENALVPLSLLNRTDGHENSELRRVKTRILGDESLFRISFFYDQIVKQTGEASIKYYIQIGSNAYETLASTPNNESAVFEELSANFSDITTVVRDVDKSKRIETMLRKQMEAESWNLNFKKIQS
jgi:hypothetical protein